MVRDVGKDWITSREILDVTGISRATLNNYIRLGIIPKPVVLSPMGSLKGVRKIGYFPREVLGRIDQVRRLKREGHYISEIARMVGGEESGEGEKPEEKVAPVTGPVSEPGKGEEIHICGRELHVTFENLSHPAYLLNYSFEISWINRKAKEIVFKDVIRFEETAPRISVFKALFSWELHGRVQNWKDLIAYHMAFAKTKYSKNWIPKLYTGVSKQEISLLEETYDRVSPLPEESIMETQVSLLITGGTTEFFRVCSLFLKEGILFIYVPCHRLYG
jgi:hypothetical protein